MAAFPLTLLALAAGTFLLLKAKKELMGKLFEALAWLIIVLSILYMLMLGMGAVRHRMEMRMMEHYGMNGHMGGGPMGWHGHMQGCCGYGQEMNCCSGMNMGGGHCGSCNMGGENSCGMNMKHEKGACCMGDSAMSGKGEKPACCMDKKEETPKPKAGK